MRKSTLFISAALTAFMLAVLFGVSSAYQNITKSTETVSAQSQPTAVVEAPTQVIPTQAIPTQAIPTQVANIAPEDAAALASKVLGRTDLFSVESAPFENVDSYLVTFSSGDLVYVSLQGQILSISKLPVTVVNQPVLRKHKNNDNGGGGGGDDHDGGGDD